MTTVRLGDLTEPMLDVVQALVNADRSSKGQEPVDFRSAHLDARRRRIDRLIEERDEWASRSDNPYINPPRVFGGRERYLYRSESWMERRRRAHDLRTSSTDQLVDVPVHAKRRYQWAEAAYLEGYLPSQQMVKEARLFDDAYARFTEFEMAVAVGRWDSVPLTTSKDVEREERRLRKLSSKGYTDGARWLQVHRRRLEIEEDVRAWQNERRNRIERAHQRAKLREGRAMLSAIRRLLRGVDQSRPPGSTPERTSPTS